MSTKEKLRAAAVILLAIGTFLVLKMGAQPQQPETPPSDLVECERLLRQAGATPDELSKFEKNVARASPTEIVGLLNYLREQSPAAMAKLVEGMHYDNQYDLGRDSLPQPGVPSGKVFDFVWDRSRIFPGTAHKIKVYIPAQYKADKPACVYVGLDDLAFEAPTVFDNLIQKGEMPITIAIGISPGTVESAGASDNPRFNRSFEFDGLSDNLARFLLEEVFPEVERHKTPDGLSILLSKDANDRAAGGVSTGGIGSFTLAWEHPDAFRRVYTASGTFVGMRGGDRYAVLVRKTEPKPIRIFLQDGSHDGMDGSLGEVGDWWMGNQALERALEFAGYQVNYVWGEGPHGSRQGTTVFPDAMRWIWKDWPQPITSGESQNVFLQAILLSGEGWQAVGGDYQSKGVPATDPQGAIIFQDAAARKTRQIKPNRELADYPNVGNSYDALAFGDNGQAYVSQAGNLFAYSLESARSTIATGIRAQDLVVTHDRKLYLTESGKGDGEGKVWLIQPNGQKTPLDTGLNHPSGIAISPDGLWLAVAENKTHWGYSYRLEPDGSVQAKQRFYWFHVPDTADDSGTGSWVMDREGRLYAATRLGVQVFDRNGRVRAILPVPGGEATGLAFGGESFDNLYVTCADGKLYRRKLKVPGAPSWATPIKLPAGSPG